VFVRKCKTTHTQLTWFMQSVSVGGGNLTNFTMERYENDAEQNTVDLHLLWPP